MNKNSTPEKNDKTSHSKSLGNAFRANILNLAWMAAIFIVAVAVGYCYSETVPDWILKSSIETMEKMEKVHRENRFMGAATYLGQITVFLYITFILGIALAIPPVYVMLSSALLTGAIASTKGTGLIDAYPHTFPDALETAAMWIALTWGARLGLAWFRQPRLIGVKDAFIEGHNIFLKVVIPLLAGAFLFRAVFGIG